jgi:hypothetical protein
MDEITGHKKIPKLVAILIQNQTIWKFGVADPVCFTKIHDSGLCVST